MKGKIIFIIAFAAAVAAVLLWPRAGERATGPLPHDAYLWQRSWTDALDAAISEHAAQFGELVVLQAEVSWPNRRPKATRVALDYPALRAANRPVGLALRIGAYSGPFAASDERTRWLADLAASLVSEAATNYLRVAELQIDFDCAESKLDGYRDWVEAIRRRLAPVPVTITALPAWLKRPGFERLIVAADGYVLQVHSWERPRDARAPFVLCDPEAARKALERAARLGKPFRVALPTYGYVAAFDAQGRFLGLSAEGPAKAWPDGAQFREIRADPKALSELVAGWKNDRPKNLTGVIWYRLPVADDTLNWRWPTLAAVMKGERPSTEVRAEMREPQPGLVEVDLVNAGQADYELPICVTLRWQQARLLATDGFQGFEVAESGTGTVRFSSQANGARLEAGERRTIGWVRLDQKADVLIELNGIAQPQPSRMEDGTLRMAAERRPEP